MAMPEQRVKEKAAYEVLMDQMKASRPRRGELESVSYSEVAEKVSGKVGYRVEPTELAEPLALVLDACEACGVPGLSALVAHKGQIIPGEGFATHLRELRPELADSSLEEITLHERADLAAVRMDRVKWTDMRKKLAAYYAKQPYDGIELN